MDFGSFRLRHCIITTAPPDGDRYAFVSERPADTPMYREFEVR